MGQEEKRKQAKRDATKARGFRRAGGGGVAPDWRHVDAEVLKWALHIVGACDGALRLGYSRDGGMFATGVYGDGEPYTDYTRTAQETTDYLTELGDYFATRGEKG